MDVTNRRIRSGTISLCNIVVHVLTYLLTLKYLLSTKTGIKGKRMPENIKFVYQPSLPIMFL